MYFRKKLLSLFGILLFLGSSVSGMAGTSCFECHEKSLFEGNSVHRPVATGECQACHQPHVARFKGLRQEEVGPLCARCHKDISHSKEQKLIHAPFQEGNCLSCHDPHASKTSGLIREGIKEICFSCHQGLPKENKFPHPPYANGECTACHLPHGADNFLLLKVNQADAICSSCHALDKIRSSHAQSALAKGFDSFPKVLDKCLTCHAPHGSNQANLLRNNLHKPFKEGCVSCHKAGGKNISSDEQCLQCHEKVREATLSRYNHLSGSRKNSCIGCHSPHAGDNENLLRSSTKDICQSCHLDTLTTFDKKLYKHPKAPYCSECHAVHGSDRIAMLRDDGNETCIRCHPTQGKFSHPIGEKAIDFRSGLPMTCVDCHTPMGTDFKYNLKLSSARELCVQCHKY